MSLIWAQTMGGLAAQLRQAIETAQADAVARRLAEAGAPPADLAQTIGAKGAASEALTNAVSAADAAMLPGRTHALVIGVAEYPHLLNGDLFADQPAALAMGLGQLTSSVVAAQTMTDWLLTRFCNEDRPLGSIELLLSPGSYTPSEAAADRLGIPHSERVLVETATLANIQAAFARWLARCSHDRRRNARGEDVGDAAIFFFSGHGLLNEVSLLLPEDFGADPIRPFDRAIDLTTTHRRMNQCKADLQCWFIDACRERPIEALKSQDKPGVSLMGDTNSPPQLRDAPIYRAAAEGRQAFGPLDPPGKPTYFTQQLICCLNGLGARQKLRGQWSVTTQSLRAGIIAAIDRLPLVDGKRVTCDTGDGAGNINRTIHYAPDPVRVLAKVLCDPDVAQPLADLYLQDQAGARTRRKRRDAQQWVIEVDSGSYSPGADFEPGDFRSVLGDETILMPPDTELPLLVQ